MLRAAKPTRFLNRCFSGTSFTKSWKPVRRYCKKPEQHHNKTLPEVCYKTFQHKDPTDYLNEEDWADIPEGCHRTEQKRLAFVRIYNQLCGDSPDTEKFHASLFDPNVNVAEYFLQLLAKENYSKLSTKVRRIDWTIAIQALQNVDGDILLEQSTVDKLKEFLREFNIPPGPLNYIALHVHKMKSEETREFSNAFLGQENMRKLQDFFVEKRQPPNLIREPYICRESETKAFLEHLKSHFKWITGEPEKKTKCTLFQSFNLNGMGKTQFGHHVLQELQNINENVEPELKQAIDNGSYVFIDFNSGGLHDTSQPIDGKLNVTSDSAMRFIAFRLLAKFNGMWTFDFIHQLSITRSEYLNFEANLVRILSKLARNNPEDSNPTILLLHIDEPQFLAENLSHLDELERKEFVKLIYQELGVAARPLWTDHKIILSVFVTGLAPYLLDPTNLESAYISLSPISNQNLIIEKLKHSEKLKDKPVLQYFKDNQFTSGLSKLLRTYGLLPFLYGTTVATLSSIQSGKTCPDVLSVLSSNLSARLANNIGPASGILSGADQSLILSLCYHSLTSRGLPRRDNTQQVQALRKIGVLQGYDGDNDKFYPSMIIPIIREYCEYLPDPDDIFAKVLIDCVNSLCLTNAVKGSTFGKQLASVIQFRGLFLHRWGGKDYCSWNDLFPNIIPVSEGNSELLEKEDIESSIFLKHVQRHPRKEINHSDFPSSGIFFPHTNQTGFDIGATTPNTMAIIQAKDYNGTVPECKLKKFFEYCSQVARDYQNKSVIGVMVSTGKFSPSTKSWVGSIPDNLSYYKLEDVDLPQMCQITPETLN